MPDGSKCFRPTGASEAGTDDRRRNEAHPPSQAELRERGRDDRALRRSRRLESGETLRGIFDVGGGTKVARQGISFQFPLQAPPAAAGANILAVGDTSTACPGLANQTPEASPGQLCLYVKSQSGNTVSLGFDDDFVTRVGFGLKAKFSAAEEGNRILGYWAVTAP